jgi:hypothetical protein
MRPEARMGNGRRRHTLLTSLIDGNVLHSPAALPPTWSSSDTWWSITQWLSLMPAKQFGRYQGSSYEKEQRNGDQIINK